MSSYFHTNETTISDFSPNFIDEMYEKGYVFTRISKGVMQQTRSVRIDLSKFELSSENRRIIKKTDGLSLFVHQIPFVVYDWHIGKMAKDFYSAKFGNQVMSAQKIKEMLTDATKSNWNSVLAYSFTESADTALHTTTLGDSKSTGYTICYLSNNIIHYSYPFYSLTLSSKDFGLGMMLRAILFAKESGLKYVYLGSLQRPTDTYKLQFAGLEWFDGSTWSNDLENVKSILVNVSKE